MCHECECGTECKKDGVDTHLSVFESVSVDALCLDVCLTMFMCVFGSSIGDHMASFPDVETQGRCSEEVTSAQVRPDLGPQLQECGLQNLGMSCPTRVSLFALGLDLRTVSVIFIFFPRTLHVKFPGRDQAHPTSVTEPLQGQGDP